MSSKELEEVSKKSKIDKQRKSYDQFFDYEWNNKLADVVKGLPEVVKGLPGLPRIVLDLALSWREASNICYMPSYTVHLLELYAAESCGKDFKEGILTSLKPNLPKLSNMKQKDVEKAVANTIDECQAFIQQEHLRLDGGTFWKNAFADNPEVEHLLRGIQRLCYSAIYFAYENFLLQIYELVSGISPYRINARDFPKDFTTQFDKTLCDYCWSADAIRIAGKVRNALAHNGGRVGKDLKGEKHGFDLIGDELQVLPIHTKALHDLLKERVTRLVEETVAKLQP